MLLCVAVVVNLWPMAMDYSVWIWNNMPMDDGMSPGEKWTSTKFPNYDHLRRAHVFGCPCYVLNPKLVEGHKIPKWDNSSNKKSNLRVLSIRIFLRYNKLFLFIA